MWKCTNCDTINLQNNESCIICGCACSTDDSCSLFLPIEKLENGAILLTDFGVIPNLAMYRIDIHTVLDIIKNVEFDMNALTESFQLIKESEDTFYTNDNEFLWQYTDEDGRKRWLIQRDHWGTNTYTVIYDDESKQIWEVDLNLVPNDYSPLNREEPTTYELQLRFSGNWIFNSTLIIITQELIKKINLNVITETTITKKATAFFNEYGYPVDISSS